MQVIESFLQGKSGRLADCEDQLVISDNFVAVIDGATTKLGKRIDGQTPGRVLALTIAEAIPKLAADIDGESAIARLSDEVEQKAIVPHYGHLSTRRFRPSASVLIYSRARRVIWRLGDCHFAINGKRFMGHKRIDDVTADARAAFNQALLLSGKANERELRSNDRGRLFIEPLLKQQTFFMNQPGEFGYGVIDGTPEAVQFLETHEAPAGAEIILASDGYTEAFPSLDEAERVRADIVANDPLLIRAHKSTKAVMAGHDSFDDRAYVRF
ncbi:MAG: hypothetical protein JNK94_03885, partial [Hyphomonadaceae bacterium]|nr:hypothetical protein [Hyphomonadaceae bacterium]